MPNLKNAKEMESKLEKLLKTACKPEDLAGYIVIPASLSALIYTGKGKDNIKLIGIDEKLINEVEYLIKRDKSYISALKMTIYHEIGHDLIKIDKEHENLREAAAEIYALGKGSMEEYIKELAVIANIRKEEMNWMYAGKASIEDSVDYMLGHDSADKWKSEEFLSELLPFYRDAKRNADKITLSYEKFVKRTVEEAYAVERLKNG